ncbi:hypothetical protein JG688_00000809 [Phytophthora aleatoria]|uniref:SAP domain-containing protein n=1 Tax=Phytophthora aleatoria TaxID=2496075 RepID=A0A8J5IWM3_9STRA|nr:hypothetical protein JG688_00000809 [Phytophthora aleatoria]
MGWYDGGDELLEEERSVRLGENALVAGIAFALFWANFGLSWYLSSRRVPEFSGFTAAQKADWCSRVNSTIHAILVVIGVAYALADISWADGFMPMSSLRAASFIFSIAIGYFLCDLIIIIVWPVSMQGVFIIHHIVAVVPYFINNFISCCAACQFGLLLFLLVELATLPLNARGFMDARDLQETKSYMRSIYTTYIIWGISRTALPIFVISHLIALFCVGVFFFVHTPEMMRIRREHRRANEATDSSGEVAISTDDADLIESEVDDVPSSKAKKPSSIRSLTLSLSRPKEPITDDSYDDIELGEIPHAMRLTSDVILRAQVSINPLRERELNLRGYKAPAIENLGVTQDGFDCIDFSDNEIKKIENFPRLRRLRMLLLHNNQVSKIQENLAGAIPNMEFLMLTGNRIAQLSEVDHLACFTKLDTLSLSGNPVTKRKYYREYVIYKLPQLHVLDFQRIRPRDREAANAFFNSVVGQRTMKEAHGESVIESTQAMKKVSITQQQATPTVSAVPPPPPPRAPFSPKKEAPVKEDPPKTTAQAEPMEETPEPKQEAPPADVDMEDADEEQAAVSYTPPKPIEQMTVTILREELKKLGLSIKGLKAELVKRLKEAAEEA